jgi:transcriptional regulator with XRE-family HTH domain
MTYHREKIARPAMHSHLDMRLRELRQSRGYSLLTMSQRTTAADPAGRGLTQSGIAYVETGERKPRLETVRMLAAALGVDEATVLSLLPHSGHRSRPACLPDATWAFLDATAAEWGAGATHSTVLQAICAHYRRVANERAA